VSAIDYAKFRSRSHAAVIRVYDESGNVIEMPSTRAISRVVSFARITSQFPLKGSSMIPLLSGGHERNQTD
jgi:hypothetical protein